MIKIKQFIGLVILMLSFTFNISAQDCGTIAGMQKGSVLEYTNFNKKDKAESKATHKITAVNSSGNRIESTSDLEITDMKGNPFLATEAYFTCEDGDYIADLSRMFGGGEALGALSGGDVNFEGKGLRYPKTMKVGDQLEDAYGKMSLGAEGVMNIEVTFTDREVESKETITTPAGTFECFVVSYTVNTKMLMNIKASAKEYYSTEIGIVRTEQFNRRGKYTGKNELTKWVK